MAARFTDEAGAGHAGKQPLSTPSGARGRGRPRAQSSAGQMREAGPAPGQTRLHPDARERASQKARYWPLSCE